jgi:hypothetical protein
VTSSLAGWKAGFDTINLWIDKLEAKIQLFGVVSAHWLFPGHVGEAVEVWKAGLAQIAPRPIGRAPDRRRREPRDLGLGSREMGDGCRWTRSRRLDVRRQGGPWLPQRLSRRSACSTAIRGGGRLDDIKQGHAPKEKQKKEKDDLVQHLDEQLKAKQVAWALEQDAQGRHRNIRSRQSPIIGSRRCRSTTCPRRTSSRSRSAISPPTSS